MPFRDLDEPAIYLSLRKFAAGDVGITGHTLRHIDNAEEAEEYAYAERVGGLIGEQLCELNAEPLALIYGTDGIKEQLQYGGYGDGFEDGIADRAFELGMVATIAAREGSTAKDTAKLTEVQTQYNQFVIGLFTHD